MCVRLATPFHPAPMAVVKEELVQDCKYLKHNVHVIISRTTTASLVSLLREDFDPKAFASSTIQAQMVGDTLSKLANGIALLDKELYTQVVTNYEDLLSQATGIEALES